MDRKIIKKGDLLICRPNLMADIFSKSVILLVEHNVTDGTLGFMVNKKTNYRLQELLKEFKDITVSYDIYKGGPVEEDNLFFLHRRPDIISNSIMICDGIFWSSNFKDVKQGIINNLLTPKDIKFYLGYTGWGSNQLEEELEKKSWYLQSNASFNLFKSTTSNLWKEQMKSMGGNKLIWMNMPEDPTLN